MKRITRRNPVSTFRDLSDLAKAAPHKVAAMLGAHVFADYRSGVCQRDGFDVAAGTVFSHNTPDGRAAWDLCPVTVNSIKATASLGTVGVLGSGGVMPTGWTMTNPSGTPITLRRGSSGVNFDLEVSFTLPAGQEVTMYSPAIPGANAGPWRASFMYQLVASSLDPADLVTKVGWDAYHTNFTGGGGGQVTVDFPASPNASDYLYFRWSNTSGADIDLRWQIKDLMCYPMDNTNGVLRDNRPLTYNNETLPVRDVSVLVAPGVYDVFAWTSRGVVPGRVTVSDPATGFALSAAVGYEKVTRFAVWKAADYVDGMLDIIEPPRWETIRVNDTSRLARCTNRTETYALMRYHANGADHAVRDSPNRVGRHRMEVRPGDFIQYDGADGSSTDLYKRRAEVFASSSALGPLDTDIWVSQAFRVNTFGPDANTFYALIFQSKNADALSPPISVQITGNGHLTIYTLSSTESPPTVNPAAATRVDTTINAGQWHRLVLRFQFSTSGGGKLGVWLDGTEVYAYQDTPIGFNSGYGPNHHWGYYGTQNRESIIVDRANMEISLESLASRITDPLPI